MTENPLMWGVWVDQLQVGRGGEQVCRQLAEELAADDEKALRVYAMFADAEVQSIPSIMGRQGGVEVVAV